MQRQQNVLNSHFFTFLLFDNFSSETHTHVDCSCCRFCCCCFFFGFFLLRFGLAFIFLFVFSILFFFFFFAFVSVCVYVSYFAAVLALTATAQTALVEKSGETTFEIRKCLRASTPEGKRKSITHTHGTEYRAVPFAHRSHFKMVLSSSSSTMKYQ